MDLGSWGDLYQSLYLFRLTFIFSLAETAKIHEASHTGRKSVGVLAMMGRDVAQRRDYGCSLTGKMHSEVPGDSMRGGSFPFEVGRSGRVTEIRAIERSTDRPLGEVGTGRQVTGRGKGWWLVVLTVGALS